MKTDIHLAFQREGYRVESVTMAGDQMQAQLRWDNRCKPNCEHCQQSMRITRKTPQWVLDTPFGLNPTRVNYEAVQGYCSSCSKHTTVRPLGIQPQDKVTPRLMRMVSRLCRWVPTLRIPELLGISAASAWRYDKEVLERDWPAPDLNGV